MDYEKIGKFIKELRIENNMTQQQLADKIPITREAVSKWERGRNKPDRTSLEILSNLFNVTTEELILGRRNEFNNIKENKELALNLYEENNKKQKVVKYLIISIIGLIILFFAYYFISTFNSIKIYNISYEDTTNNIMVYNGIFVTTREKFYFNFSDINIPDDITKLELYYMDNNSKHTIYETNNPYINIYDYYQYERYFDYKDLNIVINNLYLLIKSDTNEYNIKLNIKKDFANNKLFFFNEDKIINNRAHLLEYNIKIDTDVIKEKFTKVGNIFYINKNSFEVYFYPDSNLINAKTINDGNNYEEWNFYIKENYIVYQKIKSNIIANSFSYDDKQYICLIDNCIFDEEKIKYFFTKLNDILGKN